MFDEKEFLRKFNGKIRNKKREYLVEAEHIYGGRWAITTISVDNRRTTRSTINDNNISN